MALLFIAVGAYLTVHCFRAGRAELRAGVATGELGAYRRGQAGFWPAILMTFAASALGLFFLVIGIVLGLGLILGAKS